MKYILLIIVLAALAFWTLGQPGLGQDDPFPQSVLPAAQASDSQGWQVDYVDVNDGASVRTISQGQRVDLRRHIATTGSTIIEFTAPW